MQPEDQPHVLVALDWLGQEIWSDDNDEYILIDDEYILDDPDQIRAYVLQHAVILDTMQIYKEVHNGEFIWASGRLQRIWAPL